MIFALGARLVDLNGTDVLVELSDHDNGVNLVNPIEDVEGAPQRARTSWMHAHGDIPYGVITDGVGDLILRVRVEGSTWAEQVTRWQAIRTAYRSATDYYIEFDMEGVTQRWLTDRPTVTAEPIDTSRNLVQCARTYELRFTVQPNPVTTIV